MHHGSHRLSMRINLKSTQYQYEQQHMIYNTRAPLSEIIAPAQSHRPVIVAPKLTCLAKLIEHPIRTSASHATAKVSNSDAMPATNKANSQLNRKETRGLLSVCELSPDNQVIKPRHAQPPPNLP
jgi:hypothetical protein